MTCVCCRDSDRLTSQVRGVELCDECAAFLRNQLAAALAEPQEQTDTMPGYPATNTFVYCAHCEQAVFSCPRCGRDEWRVEHKSGTFYEALPERPQPSDEAVIDRALRYYVDTSPHPWTRYNENLEAARDLLRRRLAALTGPQPQDEKP